MGEIVAQIRYILAETLLGWAWRLLPNGSPEQAALAQMIVQTMKRP